MADAENERFEEFFRQFYAKELMAAAAAGKRSLAVDFALLDRFDPSLADKLLNDPEPVLAAARAAISAIDLPEGSVILEPRFCNLPESQLVRIRNLRSAHIGRFLTIDGVVRRASEVKPEISIAIFQCPDCGTKISVKQTDRMLKGPGMCECGRKGTFSLADKKLFDARWVTVEEPFETATGDRPGEIAVYLKEDLTTPEMQRKADPGNRLLINGIVREMKKTSKGRMRTQMDIFIEANHVEATEIEWEEVDITKEDEARIKALAADPDIYKKLVASIAPSIFGLDEVKQAIALQLFGGVQHMQPDSTRIRGDIHVLLLGDPSTAKSQLLKLISSIIPRGKYVSGRGSTTAGLTATVLKDEEFAGGWVLEAGAMVLCHKGVIAIDEFDKMSTEDQIAMHEALEQQSYHPDTVIMLADGTKHAIGPFVDSLIEANISRTIKGKDCEILPVKDLSMLTTDFLRIYPISVNRVSRHLAPDRFYRITFSNGRSVMVTPEHPMFALNNSEIITVPAEKIRPGAVVPAPARLPIAESEITLEPTARHHHNEKPVAMPKKLDVNLASALGYIATEGHSYRGERSYEIGMTNSDPAILTDMRSVMGASFGLSPYVQESSPGVFVNRYCSAQLYNFFKDNFGPLTAKARQKAIPDMLLRTGKNCIKAFLQSAFAGDGFVDSTKFGYSTSSENLAKGYQELLLTMGIYSRIEFDQGQQSYKVVVSGTPCMQTFLQDVVSPDDKRRARIERFVTASAAHNRRHELPQSVALETRHILKELSLDDGYFYQAKKRGCGVTVQTLSKYLTIISSRLAEIKGSLKNEKNTIKIRRLAAISQQDLQERFGINHSTVSYIEKQPNHGRKAELLGLVRQLAKEKLDALSDRADELKKLTTPELAWVSVKSVEVVPNKDCKWVYDMTVEPTHAFVSECLVLHNTVSIAKASIIATLPAQVSVLAGANPKYSRFDAYKSIADQINIPDTLLSRFDIKFALRDIPDPERDAKLATHILETRLQPERVQPLLSADFLRKYIAYARKHCSPAMTRESLEQLKNFYIDMRSQATTDTIPITLRQNEALMRMAEASAKIRLSPTVGVEDAERAIAVMRYSLQQLAYDQTTGKFDIDRTEGVAASQRSKIHLMLDIIDRLEKTIGKQIPREDVLAEAEDEGMSRNDVEELLDRLIRDGTLHYPRLGVVQRTR